MSDNNVRIRTAIAIGMNYGQIDGSHHKTWVIDQMIRALSGEIYDEFIAEYKKKRTW